MTRRLEDILTQPAWEKYELEIVYHKGLVELFGEGTDEYWREYIKLSAYFVYHPTGTCRMGKKDDPRSVVNSRL